MNTSILRKVVRMLTVAVIFCCTAEAQIPLQNFKAGAYRGILQATTIIEGVGETTASQRIEGRSTGDARLSFMSAPQLANSLMGDEILTKRYFLEYFGMSETMALKEITAPNGTFFIKPLSSLSVKGNTVRAESIHDQSSGGQTVTTTVRIRLTWVGK